MNLLKSFFVAMLSLGAAVGGFSLTAGCFPCAGACRNFIAEIEPGAYTLLDSTIPFGTGLIGIDIDEETVVIQYTDLDGQFAEAIWDITARIPPGE